MYACTCRRGGLSKVHLLLLTYLLLLAVVPALGAGGRRHDLWVGRLHPFATVHDAVAAGALIPSADEVVVHLPAGRHYVGQPLELDQRHDNMAFLGHGTAVAPSSISGGRNVGGGDDEPPHNGGLNLSTWAVVGPAHCAGCTEIWRAPILKGVDSRQLYVNGVRANRTWAPVQTSPNITARGTTPGDPKSDKILLPGNEMMLAWTHNVTAIELVYRGGPKDGGGSQWQESRCPVAAIAKAPAALPPAILDRSTVHANGACCASYCPLANCPICCGAAGSGGTVSKSHTIPCNASTSHQCSVVCPAATPFCIGYVVSANWGLCIKTLPPVHGVEVTVQQPCVGNGNMKCGGGQAQKVPVYVENVFELLGSAAHGHPGDFFLDASAGFVYYVPNAGEHLASTVGVLPMTEMLIEAKGVRGIKYSNIFFEHTTWMRPSTSLGFVDVQSGYCLTCPNEEIDHCLNCALSKHHEATPAALRFFGSSNVTFTDCTFRHLGSNALSFTLGSQGNLVDRSEFYDLSASAIAIGNRTNPIRPNSVDWDLDNNVIDSSIHHVAREYRGAPGILVGYTHATSLLHNEISHIPYSGISLGWGWDSFPYSYDGANRIEANHIHHHMQIMGDGGGIYALGTQGNLPFAVDANGRQYKNKTAVLRPSTMVRNYIHDGGNASTAALDHNGLGAGSFAPGGLYTDEGSTNWNMSINVIARVQWWLNGCRDQCDWIGPDWQDNNWYDSSSKNPIFGPNGIANNETRCPTHGNVEVKGSVWPKEALAIMAAAGPRPAAPRMNGPPAPVQSRRTPPLGWTSWATVGCSIDCVKNPDYCLSERVLMQMMDAVVVGGWSAAGYTMLHVDDCAFTVRDSRGELVADPLRFTNGSLENLAAYAHKKGLFLGAYLDMGNHTCDWGHPPPPKGDGEFPNGPGSYTHEATDIATLARWGIDQVKVDGCYRPDNTTRYWEGFSMIADAIAASGRDIWLACEAMMYMEDDGCSHSTAADPKCAKNFSAGGPARLAAYRRLLAPGRCNSMTVKLDDVQNYFLPRDPPAADGADGSVGGTIDFFAANQDVLAAQVKPGHYNDPEWLLAGTSGQWMPDYRPKNHATSPTSPFVLTPSQTTAQFVLYSLLSVPLLLGLDFRRINQQPQYADLRALLQNPEILAISQDALSEQGRRLWSRPVMDSTLEVWSTDLTDGVAVDKCTFAPHDWNAVTMQAVACIAGAVCTQELCCAACVATPPCVAAVLDAAGQCYLKTMLTSPTPCSNCTSCLPGKAPPVPGPVPPPPPPSSLGNSTLEVWSKNLTDGVAVVLFNHCRTPACVGTHTVNATMAELGLASWSTVSVRDLIHRRNLPSAGTAGISVVLGADSVALFKLSRVHRASTSQSHKSDDTDAPTDASPRPADCSVTAFGAKPNDDTVDDSEAFEAALAACFGGKVIVPFGHFRLDRTVDVGNTTWSPGRNRTCDGVKRGWGHCNVPPATTHLHLEHGAAVRRLATHSAAITPVLRVAQFGCWLTGDGGSVESENPSPRGVVNLGPSAMPSHTPDEIDIGGAHGAIQFARISGIRIIGQYRCTNRTRPGCGACVPARNFSRSILGCVNHGDCAPRNLPWTNTSGYEQCGMFPGQTASIGQDGSVGLCVDSAEPFDMGMSVTYQNTVKDLVIVGTDVGLYSSKWTNANHFGNLQFISNGAVSMWFDGVDESQVVGTFTGGEYPGNPWPTGSESFNLKDGDETFRQILRVTGGGQNDFHAVAGEPGQGQFFFFDNTTVQNTLIGSDNCPFTPSSRDPSFLYLTAGSVQCDGLDLCAKAQNDRETQMEVQVLRAEVTASNGKVSRLEGEVAELKAMVKALLTKAH